MKTSVNQFVAVAQNIGVTFERKELIVSLSLKGFKNPTPIKSMMEKSNDLKRSLVAP